MKVSIAYTKVCLPDYFGGDARPWVTIYPTEKGYTSRELREAILNEFRLGAVGGNHPITWDYIHDKKMQQLADKFYQKALPACLNREIKYKGKKLNRKSLDISKKEFESDYGYLPVLYVVFNIDF